MVHLARKKQHIAGFASHTAQSTNKFHYDMTTKEKHYIINIFIQYLQYIHLHYVHIV